MAPALRTERPLVKTYRRKSGSSPTETLRLVNLDMGQLTRSLRKAQCREQASE